MDRTFMHDTINDILNTLCITIGERSTGSPGNRKATDYVRKQFQDMGWVTETPSFDAIDWLDGGAVLKHGDENFRVLASPYSLGFSGEAALVSASTVEELEALDARDKFILLHGAIASEQLMPRNFVFYNPESHRRIIADLDKSGAKALICATGRNPSLAGGVYPFPLIEDGDFDIPSVYTTEEEGSGIKAQEGKVFSLKSVSERIPGKGYNVIARKGKRDGKRIVITAHIDAKKGTSGAIDNATGVTILVLLAGLLKDYSGEREIEIVALNGEDYYAVPGQMNYINANYGRFDTIMLNINIDGAGYKEGPSAFSLFDLPAGINDAVQELIAKSDKIVEGIKWPQGDHSIFLQSGVPAIAVSSDWFGKNIDTQDITHTEKDNLSIVDSDRLAETALALESLIRKI